MTANDELRKMIGLASQVNVGRTSIATDQAFVAGVVAKNVYGKMDRYELQNEIDPLTGSRRVPLAEGGIVTRPTNALIGESGAEAVIPLDRMGGFGTTVNVNVAGSVISEGELQSVIQDALYNLNRAGAVTQLTNLGR
jgi:hypothetical protein